MPKFDQHFLVDRNISSKIISALDISNNDIICEIGPGKGILTNEIVKKAKKVYAIEIDKILAKSLHNKLSKYSNFILINCDFLDFNLEEISNIENTKIKIVGNLPYSITTPIINKIIKFKNWFSAVFMIQKEVALRMISKPGNKSFSRLTTWINFYTKIQLICDVSKNCFRPIPRVDSTVIKLLPSNLYEDYKYEDKLFDVISKAFSHKRKTILNSIQKEMNIDKENLSRILEAADIDPKSRPEEIPLEKYLKLTEILCKKIFIH